MHRDMWPSLLKYSFLGVQFTSISECVLKYIRASFLMQKKLLKELFFILVDISYVKRKGPCCFLHQRVRKEVEAIFS